MTSGKKLQELYDAGIETLNQLADSTTADLNAAKSSSSTEIKANIETNRAKINETASVLHKELTDKAEQSLERLAQLAVTEIDEATAYGLDTVNELLNHLDKLKAKITDLNSAYEAKTRLTAQDFSGQYTAASEKSKLDLEKNEYEVHKRLRSQSHVALQSWQNKLDVGLEKSRTEARQVLPGLLKGCAKKADTINEQFSLMVQKLSLEFQALQDRIKTGIAHGDNSLEATYKQIATKVDSHANAIENKISETFKSNSESHAQALDKRLSSIAQDLSELHDASTKNLEEAANEHAEELQTAGTLSQENLRRRFQEIVKQVADDKKAFSDRLQERMMTGTSLRRALEDDKDKVLSSVRAQLNEIESSFESRVLRLKAEAKEHAGKLALIAERDISESKNRCEQGLINKSLAAKRNVDEQIEKFLVQIAQCRSVSLNDITRAAEGRFDKADEPSKSKRTITPNQDHP